MLYLCEQSLVFFKNVNELEMYLEFLGYNKQVEKDGVVEYRNDTYCLSVNTDFIFNADGSIKYIDSVQLDRWNTIKFAIS